MGLIGRLRGCLEVFRSARATMLLSVLIVAGIGTTASLLIWHEREVALEEHEHEMNSMGVVLSEQTSRYAQVIDLILRQVQSQVALLNVATSEDFRRQSTTEETRSYLAERVTNVPQVDAIVLIDANGHSLNSSRPLPNAVDVSDQEYYKHFRERDDPGLFVGSVSKGSISGNSGLFFARRINGRDGKYCGLVLGIVDIKSLSAFYQAASEHTTESVILLRRDGTMLMRYPNPEMAVGARLPAISPWYSRVAEGGGSYFTETTFSAISSLVTVHPLIGYPLVVDVAMGEKDIFDQWRKEAAYIAGFASTAALIFAGLFWMLSHQFKRQAAQNDELEVAAILLSQKQQILRAYAEMSADWLWELDADLRFKSTSYSVTEAGDIGKTPWELADPEMDEQRWVVHKVGLAARQPFRNFRWERIGPGGERLFISTNGAPIFAHNGVFSGYRGTGRDITGEVAATAKLLQLNADLEVGRRRFNAVLNSMSQGVCLFNDDKRLVLSNRRYAAIYNLPPESTRPGRSLEQIVTERYAAGSAPDMPEAEFLAWRDRVVAEDQPASAVTRLKNGRVVAIQHQPMPDGGWVAIHEDITERQQAEASIVFMAHHDALTKLPNRMLFRERVEQAIAMAGRGTDFAVICLDLDNFKQINDTLGHPVGDELLVAVADRLQSCVREVDTVARLGGDEFAIIQIAVQHPEDAEVLASRLIAAFRQPFDVAERQIMSGASIGITVVSGATVSYETLMRDADIALYLAKTEGRGTVRFFEPEMDARVHLRRVLEADLQGALTRNEFELYYQPQIDLTSDSVSGFEALLRWNHPVRGVVSPLDFIPVAEETGIIGAIGGWVLRMACFEAENWPDGISVAVNLSPIQFKKGDVVPAVQAALAASGLRPDRLELEITESVFLRDTADTLAALHQLRSMGVCVALDDFGTGYSSLSYLRSFPFGKIKIDKSFVRDLMTDNGSISIIRAVIGLGLSLGMRTIAEGVETQEQLDRLREEGCDEVQGYLFSRPRPAGEVPSLIERLQRMSEEQVR
jgi:diguanylate cyclase (GGDEF)-like protein